MPETYHIYKWYIPNIYHEYNIHITYIHLNMSCIYLVYTSIYIVYTKYLPFLFLYIQLISHVPLQVFSGFCGSSRPPPPPTHGLEDNVPDVNDEADFDIPDTQSVLEILEYSDTQSNSADMPRI